MERRNQKAGTLSGGEQQMLTICRSLLGNPLVLLVDEPTEGLAPKIVDVVTEVIRDIHRKGVGVLLVEQKMATVAPASRKDRAMARPIPVAPPVTSALRPTSAPAVAVMIASP